MVLLQPPSLCPTRPAAMPVNPSKVLYAYGAFLISGGLLAFAMSGFEARAKTAIIMGCGCGISMLLLGYFGSTTRPRLLVSARYLVAAFLGLFMFRGYKIIDVPEKRYLLLTFFWLSAGSAVTLAMLLISVRDAAVLKAQREILARKQRNTASSAASAEAEMERKEAARPRSAAGEAAKKAGGQWQWGPTSAADNKDE